MARSSPPTTSEPCGTTSANGSAELGDASDRARCAWGWPPRRPARPTHLRHPVVGRVRDAVPRDPPRVPGVPGAVLGEADPRRLLPGGMAGRSGAGRGGGRDPHPPRLPTAGGALHLVATPGGPGGPDLRGRRGGTAV